MAKKTIEKAAIIISKTSKFFEDHWIHNSLRRQVLKLVNSHHAAVRKHVRIEAAGDHVNQRLSKHTQKKTELKLQVTM